MQQDMSGKSFRSATHQRNPNFYDAGTSAISFLCTNSTLLSFFVNYATQIDLTFVSRTLFYTIFVSNDKYYLLPNIADSYLPCIKYNS